MRTKNVTYGIDDNPPWYLSFFMAIQHYLTMIGAIVSIPFILTPALCMEDENPERGTIICTMIFVTGLVTIIQATWGCRLPLIQVRNQFFFSSPRARNLKVIDFLGRNNIVSSSNISNLEFGQVEVSSERRNCHHD